MTLPTALSWKLFTFGLLPRQCHCIKCEHLYKAGHFDWKRTFKKLEICQGVVTVLSLEIKSWTSAETELFIKVSLDWLHAFSCHMYFHTFVWYCSVASCPKNQFHHSAHIISTNHQTVHIPSRQLLEFQMGQVLPYFWSAVGDCCGQVMEQSVQYIYMSVRCNYW